MKFKTMNIKYILCLTPTLLFGDTTNTASETSLIKILAAAIIRHTPQAGQPALQIGRLIHKKIQSNNDDALEAHKQARQLVEKFLPQPDFSFDSNFFEGTISKEELNEFKQELIFELQIPLSIIKGAIEKQLELWNKIECPTEKITANISSAKYVLNNLNKIDFALRISKWLSENPKNFLRDWIRNTQQYKNTDVALEQFYVNLQDELGEVPTGEMALDKIASYFKLNNSIPMQFQDNNISPEEAANQQLILEIIDDVQNAMTTTKELYMYAFDGITDNSEKKEAKITSLIILLSELFNEIETFSDLMERGLKEQIKGLEIKIKRSPNSSANLAQIKELLNAIKTQKFITRGIDWALSSKTTLFTTLRKHLEYEEEDTLLMKLINKII